MNDIHHLNDTNDTLPSSSEPEATEETSKYHGPPGSETDWRGRSFLEVPLELRHRLDNPLLACRLPSRPRHCWRAHRGAVVDLQLFPRSGHLLLTAGVDGLAKLWDFSGARQLRRSFSGHRAALTSVDFSRDGRGFLSASRDRCVKLWDTETGQCAARLRQHPGFPTVARLQPLSSAQHMAFVAGASHDVLQYDLRASCDDPVVRYEGHLQPVNTITFLDDDRKFATSSDDKSIRFWDVGVPREIRRVADAEMHSMPSAAVHPAREWVAFQSLDNRVLVFEARGKFKVHPDKKHFVGHQVGGFGCQLSFSPDGQFLASGSYEGGRGRLCVWDWASGRLLTKLDAHRNQVCIGCRWHPIHPSSLITWGWDGTIQLFE